MSALTDLVEHLVDAHGAALMCQADAAGAGDLAASIRYGVVVDTLRRAIDPLLREILGAPPRTDIAAYLREAQR